MPLIESYVHGQFCWAELVAHDMAAAVGFYADVLGWTTADLNTACDDCLPHVQFEVNGQPVAGLIQMMEPLRKAGVPGMWNTYVCVDDLQSALDSAVQLGATITCPVTNAGEHGLIAFVKDPTGGVIGLWQSGSHGGSALRGDTNTVCWNELATRDLTAACDFYGSLFGWSFEENPGSPVPYVIICLNHGKQVGGIMQMTAEWGEMPSHWTIYFQVDAVDSVAARVQQLNGAMVVPPFDTPVGRIAVVSDNQGAAFSVIRLEHMPEAEPVPA